MDLDFDDDDDDEEDGSDGEKAGPSCGGRGRGRSAVEYDIGRTSVDDLSDRERKEVLKYFKNAKNKAADQR